MMNNNEFNIQSAGYQINPVSSTFPSSSNPSLFSNFITPQLFATTPAQLQNPPPVLQISSQDIPQYSQKYIVVYVPVLRLGQVAPFNSSPLVQTQFANQNLYYQNQVPNFIQNTNNFGVNQDYQNGINDLMHFIGNTISSPFIPQQQVQSYSPPPLSASELNYYDINKYPNNTNPQQKYIRRQQNQLYIPTKQKEIPRSMNQLFELQREIEIMNIIGDKMKKFAELHKLIIGMDENDIQASINQNFFIWLKDHFFSSQYIIQLEIITMLQDIIYRGEQISPSKKKSIFFRPLNRSRFLWGIHILINKQAEIQEKSKDQQYEDSEFMQKCLDVLFGVMRERYMVEEQLREICGKVLIHCLNKLITYLIEASKTLKTQPHLGIMTSNRFSDEMRRGIQTLHTLSCATQNKITQNFLVEKFRIHEAITPLLHINCDYLACEHRIQLPFSLKLEKLQLAILDAVSSLCEKDEVIQAYLVQEVRLIPHLSQILITFASQLCPNFKQSKFENFQSSPQSIQSPLQQPETIEQLKQSETSDKSNTSHTNPIQHSTSTQSPQSQNSSQPSGTAAIRITQQLYYAVLELLEYILDGNRLSAEGICFEPSLVSAFAALSQVQRKQSNQFILDEQVAVEIRIRSIWYLRQVQMNGGDKVQRSLVKDGIYTKRVLTDAISSSGGNSEDCVDVIKESLFGLTQLIMTLREGNSICQGQTTLLELVTEQLEEEGAVQEVDAQVFCTKELITSGVRATAIQTQTRLIFYI